MSKEKSFIDKAIEAYKQKKEQELEKRVALALESFGKRFNPTKIYYQDFINTTDFRYDEILDLIIISYEGLKFGCDGYTSRVFLIFTCPKCGEEKPLYGVNSLDRLGEFMFLLHSNVEVLAKKSWAICGSCQG
jgi:hypothetical protein